MRKSIFILTTVLLLSTIGVFATTPEISEPKTTKALTIQIYNMLGENLIPNDIRGSKAEVRVAVDTGNYLRILSIETENEALEKFIKTRIDFRKLSNGTYEQGIVYRIPLEVRE